ncbi:hypothetical protein AUK11_04580 [bacterium CG2_30_37_16]|nr:MAG: hypothetical protein AUK11_04580 [bacterium CG2_30_37_16]PJB05498.1 MAG: hypothetical protein CO123_04065 [bacterium (Candidatus Howlettbacteria) CG_4_9_14_3_um_filter_37_10]
MKNIKPLISLPFRQGFFIINSNSGDWEGIKDDSSNIRLILYITIKIIDFVNLIEHNLYCYE